MFVSLQGCFIPLDEWDLLDVIFWIGAFESPACRIQQNGVDSGKTSRVNDILRLHMYKFWRDDEVKAKNHQTTSENFILYLR